jgi:cytochrome c-type biogenesis protein CcmH
MLERTLPRWLFVTLAALLLVGLLFARTALAKEAVPMAADAAQEARMMGLAAELRCLVCQNQTIADSHADLAVDLRNQIREMLAKGQNEDQIRKYMTDRYGDFVLYKPPFKATTALLWAGPPALLVIALLALFLVLRSRQRASPDAFDPDFSPATDEEQQPTPAAPQAQRR